MLKRKSKRKKESDFQQIVRNLLRISREILKDGYLNGKEKDIKRKAKKEQERHKDWLLSTKSRLKMYLQQVSVQVENK
jgi:hypothetical protein